MIRFVLFNLIGFVCAVFPAMATPSQEEKPEISQTNSGAQTSIWGITEDQLDELFEMSSDYMVLTGQYQLHRVNKRWTEILGWTAEELTSRPFVDFIHPEDTDSTKGAVHKGSNIDCVINFKNRYRTKVGSYHLIEWFGLRQVSGINQKPLVLGIGKDLTLERQAEEQRYALQQAEAATRLKSTFVAHMSHEIRTPLNGVLGFLDLALEEKMSDTVRSHLQNAQESSHFLLDVANDIIDVSKIEAGALKIETVNFNPFTAVKAVVSMLNLQAQKKGLILKSSFSPDLPPVLKGDENRLKQILINLVSNAIKFTSQGHVSLKINGRSQGRSPPTFLLQGRIKDTGIGIEPDFIPQLFKPFSQEDHSMRRQFGGAGLGLYITKQLCERMGGTINVLSTPHKGTTFQFHVICGQPVLRSPYKLRKSNTLSMPESPNERLTPLPSYSKILVVEDNLMNQKVVSLLLEKLGYQVDLADNGQLGLEAIRHKTYDLVLMDGEMPVMDGLQATQEIRKQYSAQQLPIIGLSAHAMSTHREQFLSVGMNGYLTKPLNKEALTQEISRCFKEVSTPGCSSTI